MKVIHIIPFLSKENCWRRTFKRLKAAILIALLITSFLFTFIPQKAQACKWYLLCLDEVTDGLFGGVGSDAAGTLADAIKDGVDVNVGVDLENQDIEHIYKRVVATIGIGKAEALSLVNHVDGKLATRVNETLGRFDESAAIVHAIGKNLISDSKAAIDSSIKETLLGIERQTKLMTSELSSIILELEKATHSVIDGVEVSSTRVINRAESASTNIIRTAMDDLAALTKISREQAEKLVKYSGDQLSIILSKTGDEVAQLIELTSDEAKEIIQEAREASKDIINEGGKVLDAVITSGIGEFNRELRVTLKDAFSGLEESVDIISDDIAEHFHAALEASTESMQEIISDTSDEVQEIVDAVRVGRLEVLNRGGEIVYYLVDRTADLVLALITTCLGLIFLFVYFNGWGKAILTLAFPQEYIRRMLFFFFMGMTFVVSVSPFWFSIPSNRVAVLSPMAQTKAWAQLPQLPLLPTSPSISRVEPEVIGVQRDSFESIKYLRIYGRALKESDIIAKFGNSIELNIPGKANYALVVDLRKVYENPNLGNGIDIFSKGELLVSIPVENYIQSEAFEQGIRTASEAVTLRRKAKKPEEWLEVIKLWEKARDLMKSVDSNAFNFRMAQQKAVEYQLYVDDARRKHEDSKPKPQKPITDTKSQEPIPKSQSEGWVASWLAEFPMAKCGETDPAGHQKWYPVYVNYSEKNFAKVSTRYCKDSFRNLRDDLVRDGRRLHSIQVASFRNREKSVAFAQLMRKEMGSGEVGPVNYK